MQPGRANPAVFFMDAGKTDNRQFHDADAHGLPTDPPVPRRDGYGDHMGRLKCPSNTPAGSPGAGRYGLSAVA